MAFPYVGNGYQMQGMQGGYGWNGSVNGAAPMQQGFGSAAPMQQAQPTTNKIFVVSAEDALSRFASPNSIMVYQLQDETKQFEVFTDGQGRKSIRTRSLVDAAPEQPAEYATKAELEQLKKMIDGIKGGTES